MSDLRDLIAKALPFALSPPVLAELADAAQPVEALEGDLIYEFGATANALYIVRDGTVLLEPSASGAPLPSQAIQAGEAFGWTALGGKAGRRYRAIAVTAASLLRIDGNRVLDLAAAEARDGTRCASRWRARCRISATPKTTRSKSRRTCALSISRTGCARRRLISA